MSGRVVCVGGAVLDVLSISGADPLPGTSNPGRIRTAAGGVARNVAENLARLGSRVDLVAAIGADPAGVAVHERCVEAGIGLDHLIRAEHGTGIYSAILTPEGDLSVAIADLGATEQITVEQVEAACSGLTGEDYVLVDGNLLPEVAQAVLALARRAGARTIAEPVGVPKAHRLRPAVEAEPPWMITPNLEELIALVGGPVNFAHVEESAVRLLDMGIAYAWVRLGRQGSTLVWREADGTTGHLAFSAPLVPVINVTGAGDALTAGFVHAMLRGSSPAAGAAYGHIVSALTVSSDEVVRSDLTEDLVRDNGGLL